MNISVSAATMSSSQSLRDFIRERLTAAADEIFTEFDKTIVHYEEELDRQRKLLEICWKPQIKLQRIDLPQQQFWKEEVFSDHQFYSLERICSLDQAELQPICVNEELGEPEPEQKDENQEELEPPQLKDEKVELEQPLIKGEQEELSISQEKEQLEIQQPTDSFTVVTIYKKTDHKGSESKKEQLIQISPEPEKQNQERSGYEESGSSRDKELEENKSFQLIKREIVNVDYPEIEQEMMHSNYNISACEVSGKSFAQSYLTDHMRTHTGERPFSCLTCGKNFTNKKGLYNHTQTHKSERPYSCMICGKSFSLHATLKVHIRTHTGERPFSCTTCGKSFSDRAVLYRHIRTHTGEKPFSCSICGKSFLRRSNFNEHKKTHTGEKPFSCLTCGKNFRVKASLSRHIRTHTGEKPFSCLTCGKSFIDKASLSRHILSHTDTRPFSCMTCGKRFNRRSHLTTHMVTHRGDQVQSSPFLNHVGT